MHITKQCAHCPKPQQRKFGARGHCATWTAHHLTQTTNDCGTSGHTIPGVIGASFANTVQPHVALGRVGDRQAGQLREAGCALRVTLCGERLARRSKALQYKPHRSCMEVYRRRPHNRPHRRPARRLTGRPFDLQTTFLLCLHNKRRNRNRRFTKAEAALRLRLQTTA